MQVMTRDQEQLLRKLVELAGDPEVLEQALEEARAEGPDPVPLEDLIRQILLVRNARQQTPAA